LGCDKLSDDKASDQLIKFLSKKGDYYVELAQQHLHDNEPEKARELLESAVSFYSKAGLKDKIEETRKRIEAIGKK
jgi:lipopolysaccharide biosynthesis regulator YciM